MRKKLSSLLVLVFFCSTMAFGAINALLQEAQDLLKRAQAAKSEQLYIDARQKFNAARNDVNYESSTDDQIIKRGLEACRKGLASLSKKLTVNGSTNAIETNVEAAAGNVTYRVSSTVGNPEVANLPAWINVVSNNGSEIVLHYASNDTTIGRQAPFIIQAGGARVQINLRQKGVPKKVKTGPATGQERMRDLEITDVTFMNATYDNRTITAAGQPLYAHEIRYLRPVITYNGPSRDREVDLYTRIYDPQGKMLHTDELSPEGYTQGYNFQFFRGDDIEVKGMGWGHRRESLFSPGQYRFEFIIDGKVIYTAYATLIERDDDETYLAVNGETSSSVQLKGGGGTTTFFISTSDTDWKVTDLPSWLSVTKQTGDAITLQYGPNNALTDRTGDFFVQGAGRQVKVKVTQPTNGPSATLENVAIKEGVVVDGEKGIEIHANIVVNNAKNHRLQIVAWFYYETGNPLMDTDGRYRAGDGQVTVNKDVVVDQDILDLGDFTLFIPYEQLDIKDPGETALEFDMGIYDFSLRDFLASSPRVKFTYRR